MGQVAIDKSFAIPAGSELVGRDRELAQIERLLDRRSPALLLVTGRADIGKSSLLGEVQRRAAVAGWRVALGEISLSMPIDSSETSFRDQVRKIVNSQAENPSNASLDPPEYPGAQGRTVRHRGDPLVDELVALGPLLILIDGYQPPPDFHNWLMGSFLRDMKSSRAPLVLLIAETAARLDTLKDCADEILELGTLDRSALEAHFALIGRRIIPPISTVELALYVNRTLDRPDLIGSLTNVLALAPLSPAPE